MSKNVSISSTKMSDAIKITVDDSCEHEIIDDETDVFQHVYAITNTTNGKCYINHCASHKKNHGRYRPYGFESRYKEHCANVKNGTESTKSAHLYKDMREHGIDKFAVRLLCKCSEKEADDMETQYIKMFNALYPVGYNVAIKTPKVEKPVGKKGGSTSRSEETRKLISEKMKTHVSKPETLRIYTENAIKQHAAKKAEKFADVEIDPTKIDSYIKLRKCKDGNYIIVSIAGKIVSFKGKDESLETQRERAKTFILSLLK